MGRTLTTTPARRRGRSASGTARATAGDGLLHPVALLAIAVLVLNDHVLKRAYPGYVTGKLSDVAGLVVLPLALFAAAEVARVVLRRPVAPIGVRAALVVVAVIGIGFALAKLTPLGADAYRAGFGILQWPVRTLLAAATGTPVASPAPLAFVADPSDVLVLPVLLVPTVLTIRRSTTDA